MSTHATALRDRMLERVLRDYHAAAAVSAGALAPAARERAAAQLGELGWPSPRDEQWRYANLRAFEQIGEFRPLPAPSAIPEAQLPAPIPGF